MAKKSDFFFPDRIVNGQFVTSTVKELMRHYEETGEQLEVCIRPRRNYTSQPQRGWYRGMIIRMAAIEMRRRKIESPSGGLITDEEVHQMMAQKFLRVSVHDTETGECFGDRTLSTSEITAGRMAEYCEEVRAWCREHLDLDIPDPERFSGQLADDVDH